jgi:hypothetical protein
MTRFSTLPRVALATGAALALALGLTGCAKKMTSVDSSYLSPEGVRTPRANLVLTPDVVVPIVFYEGTGRPVDDDSLLVFPPPPTLSSNHKLSPSPVFDGEAFGFLYLNGPGFLIGQIFDQTPVSDYQILRRESGGGYRIAAEYELKPARRWLDTEWESYGFVDQPPSTSYQPSTYLGRGTYSHHVTSESPLTNAAILVPDPIQIINFDYQGLVDQKTINEVAISDSIYAPSDSLFEMRWTPIPGAVGYWIQLYQFTGGSFDQVTSSWPSAGYVGKSRDLLVAYLPAPADHYRVGDPGAITLSRRPIIQHQDYHLKIAAVNANGQIIGATRGRPLVVPFGTSSSGEALWAVFFRGAILVRPGIPAPSSPMAVTNAARRGPAPLPASAVATQRTFARSAGRYAVGSLLRHP